MVEIPERTHTFTVFHPSRRIAAKRRAPQISIPSEVTVIGCNNPSRAIDSTSASRSP